MKIQKPTIGRIVELSVFAGWRPYDPETDKGDGAPEGGERAKPPLRYAGIIVGVHDRGVVDIVTFGPQSIYHNNGVAFDQDGQPLTSSWRYPPRCDDLIDV